MNSWRKLTVLLLLTGVAQAGDWEWSFGAHDFQVPQVDSDTFGVNARVSFDRNTASGRHYFGSADMFIDNDKDDLDPDHIPIWWQLHAGTDGYFWQSGAARLGWTATIDTRINTVSSVERRITALPAIVGAIDSGAFKGSLKAGAGWWFLEIDDDVPKTFGYERGDFRNSTFAYSAEADASVRLGNAWTLSGVVQEWWDSGESLQTEYGAELRFDTDHWRKGSSVALSADYTDYNLDVYAIAGLPPILPWDHDVMYRVLVGNAW